MAILAAQKGFMNRGGTGFGVSFLWNYFKRKVEK